MDDWCYANSSNSSTIGCAALNNLTLPCPANFTERNGSFIYDLNAPSTFFIQLLRFILAVALSIIVGALYNSVEVLDQVIYSLASCSFHWVLYLIIIAIKSLLLLVCVIVPVIPPAAEGRTMDVNLIGFIAISLLHLASVTVLFCSLEHEYCYRSPDYSSVDAPFTTKCVFISKWRRLLSWPRLLVLILVTISITLLVVVEATQCQYCYLQWVWLATVVLLKIATLCIGLCVLCRRAESFQPTIPAKLYLLLMMVLSIGDELPSSFLTIYPFTSCQDACVITYVNLYDIVQLLGGVALIPLLLFVRSQYLRVEQESKLLVVWDMQKLLQVNGRHDITTH